MANPSEEPMRGVRSEFRKKSAASGAAQVSIRLKCSSNLEIVIGALSSRSGFLSRRTRRWANTFRAVSHLTAGLRGFLLNPAYEPAAFWMHDFTVSTPCSSFYLLAPGQSPGVRPAPRLYFRRNATHR